jgi:hypothetical protein
MLYSIANNRRYYGSDKSLSSARKKRHILEEYPSRLRGTSEYNLPYDAFRPITPPYFYQQFQDRRGSIYDRPCGHHFDNEQHRSSYKRNIGK